MSEAPAEQTPPAEPQEQPKPQEGEAQSKEQQQQTFDADYVEKLRKEAAQHRTERNALAKELEKQRQASMSEAEKAVAEAETRGRQAAVSEFGQRLARTEFDALAGRRNPETDTSKVLQFVDLARFVGDDGEPDSKAIAAAVSQLVPAAPGTQTPSFDGGSRTPAPQQSDMNQILRRQLGRA